MTITRITLKKWTECWKRCLHREKHLWNQKKTYSPRGHDSSPRPSAKWDHTLFHSCWEKIPHTCEDQPWIWGRRLMDKSYVFWRTMPCFLQSCCSYKRSERTEDRRAAKQVWVPRQATLSQSDYSNVARNCGVHGDLLTIFPPLFHKLFRAKSVRSLSSARFLDLFSYKFLSKVTNAATSFLRVIRNNENGCQNLSFIIPSFNRISWLKFVLSTPDVIVFSTSQQGWTRDSRVEGEWECSISKKKYSSLERYPSKRAHPTPLPGHSSGICDATCKRTQANNSNNCWPTMLGFHVARSLTDFKICVTSPNNIQQDATGCANGRNMYHPTMLRVVGITFTSNGKSEFVPSVAPLTFRLLFFSSTYKLVVSRNFLSIRIVLSCLFEKLSTWMRIWCFSFAVWCLKTCLMLRPFVRGLTFVIFSLQKAGIALLWRQQKESMKRTRLVFLNEWTYVPLPTPEAKRDIVNFRYKFASCQGRPGGGSGIPVYPKKIRQNTPKYPKFIQIYPKLYPRILYTVKFKESDIPNIRI